MPGLLHIVNKSAGSSRALHDCLLFFGEQDALLFIEDGIYNALNNHINQQQIRDLSAKSEIFALTPDLQARGIVKSKLTCAVKLIDYAGFVDLAVKYKVIKNWS